MKDTEDKVSIKQNFASLSGVMAEGWMKGDINENTTHVQLFNYLKDKLNYRLACNHSDNVGECAARDWSFFIFNDGSSFDIWQFNDHGGNAVLHGVFSSKGLRNHVAYWFNKGDVTVNGGRYGSLKPGTFGPDYFDNRQIAYFKYLYLRQIKLFEY